MPPGGQTTVIQRILEQRAQRPPVDEDTTATIAVMLRVVPPPKALLVCQELQLRQQLVHRVTPDMLDLESVDDLQEAERRCAAMHVIVVTDSLKVVRALRTHPAARSPFILYVAELDDAAG